MNIRDFLKEDHPDMFVSTDGKIGRISGVSFVRTHVYVREAPKLVPDRLWYWVADKVTYSVIDMPSEPPGAPTPAGGGAK